jgi:hypothetical protein
MRSRADQTASPADPRRDGDPSLSARHTRSVRYRLRGEVPPGSAAGLPQLRAFARVRPGRDHADDWSDALTRCGKHR